MIPSHRAATKRSPVDGCASFRVCSPTILEETEPLASLPTLVVLGCAINFHIANHPSKGVGHTLSMGLQKHCSGDQNLFTGYSHLLNYPFLNCVELGA